jgi:hypothetical protein
MGGCVGVIGVDQIRVFAMTLPEVEEGPPVRPARRIAAFKVAGKSFAGVEGSGLSMTVSLAESDAKAYAAQKPDAYEEIWRNRVLLGLRVDLSKISVDQMKDLIRKSWQHTVSSRKPR